MNNTTLQTNSTALPKQLTMLPKQLTMLFTQASWDRLINDFFTSNKHMFRKRLVSREHPRIIMINGQLRLLRNSKPTYYVSLCVLYPLGRVSRLTIASRIEQLLTAAYYFPEVVFARAEPSSPESGCVHVRNSGNLYG